MKTYLVLSGLIFLIVAVVHVLRLAQGWPVVLAGHDVPTWGSWVAVLLAGTLSLTAFSLLRRSPRAG